MFIGTLKISRAHQVIFLSLTVLFFLLAIGDFSENHIIKTIAGFEGIFCGASAFYTAVALVLNEGVRKDGSSTWNGKVLGIRILRGIFF